MFNAIFSAGALHKNSSHGFGRRREEVTAALPLLIRPDEAQIRFVHQVGRLQSLPGRFVRQLTVGKAAKLVVDNGQQLVGSLQVAGLDPLDQPRHFVHESAAGSGNTFFREVWESGCPFVAL
jgi:hypothetical protein